jgi:hypothetical protein
MAGFKGLAYVRKGRVFIALGKKGVTARIGELGLPIC